MPGSKEKQKRKRNKEAEHTNEKDKLIYIATSISHVLYIFRYIKVPIVVHQVLSVPKHLLLQQILRARNAPSCTQECGMNAALFNLKPSVVGCKIALLDLRQRLRATSFLA